MGGESRGATGQAPGTEACDGGRDAERRLPWRLKGCATSPAADATVLGAVGIATTSTSKTLDQGARGGDGTVMDQARRGIRVTAEGSREGTNLEAAPHLPPSGIP
eukprot:scaffold241211_cov30-Tisochrysis_lutea.AAC.3